VPRGARNRPMPHGLRGARGAGGRSAVATVVDRVVAELVDWVVARLAGAVVAMVVGRVVAWVVASAVAIVVGAVVAIVVTTGLVDRRRALGKCPAASHAASRRRTFDHPSPIAAPDGSRWACRSGRAPLPAPPGR
jgi:hypothetical protein